jgi:hypothetical protein
MDSNHRIVRTFHSTCMIADYDATVSALARLAGLRVLEYSEQEIIGRRGGMTWIGDNSIEIAQPIVDGHASDRFLRRHGPGMHSYAIQVADLEATIEHLERGQVTVGVRPGPGFFFSDPRSTGGLLFEWSDFTVKEDPRIGAPTPEFTVDPLLDVSSHAFVGAVVPDPIEWAERYGPLFGMNETFRDMDAAPGEPVVGVAAPDCTLALYPLPGSESVELWGVELPRARCHVLGLGVPNLDDAARALAAAGVATVRRTERAIVVDPRHSGQIPVVLVDQLLKGDPRASSAPI